MRLRPPALLAAAAAVSSLAGPAAANDSTASFAAGGLVLEKTDAIAMRSEDLFLSTDRITVSYVFHNKTDAPVTTRVAFPVPDVPWSPYSPISIPNDDPANPLGFETTVAGKPVEMELEQRAKLDGTDITERLAKLGVPLAPQDPKAVEALDALPKAVQDELVAANIATIDEFDAGNGWERHLQPMWSWSGTYHWEQTFPAGADLKVEHSYMPSVGGSVATVLGMGADYPDEVRDLRERYCVDDAFMKTFEKRSAEFAAKNQDYSYAFAEQNFEYVLKTGANWAEPIGAFRLTVDKGAPENLVSFCAEGVKKLSPTRFEVRHENWTPTNDIAVLILIPVEPPPAQ